MSGIIGKVATGSETHLVTSTFYGTCATAASTKLKVVKLADTNIDSATLLTGMTLAVKFTYSNTVASPTLKVQRGGNTTDLISAKSIKQYGTTAPGTTEAASWRAGAVVLFIYDGTNWVMVSSIDNDTAYTHPTATATAAAAVKVGQDSLGHVVLGNALTAADISGALYTGTNTLTNGYLLAADGTSGQVKSAQVTTGTVNSLSTNYDSTNERLEFITVSGMSVVTSIGDIPTLVDGNGASY